VKEGAKRIGVSWRTTPAFKAKLDAAVAASQRSLMQEIELRLTLSLANDDALGGPRVAALLRTLAALASRRDGDQWLDDPVLFNTITARWNEHLDVIRPKPSPADEAQIAAEFAELRQFIEQGATPEGRNSRRQIARKIAETGLALDPAWRARYAALAAEESV
jgi:hypothetical protein